MPIFEYRCGSCGGVFEQLVRGAGERVACPACASPRVVRLMSAPAATPAGVGATSRQLPQAGGCCGGGGCGCHN